MQLLPNNIDFMRLMAALMVLISHAYPIYGLREPVGIATGFETLGGYAVAIFFVISGFLITGSYNHNPNPFVFFKNRLLRLVPALAVLTILTIIFTAICITTLPFQEFISHANTIAYLKNILIYPLQYNLPETFTTLQNPVVNGSLWTLPVEFTAYLMILFLGILRLLKPSIILLLYMVFFIWYQYAKTCEDIMLLMPVKYMAKYGCFFFAGSVMYFFRDKIKIHRWAILLSLLAMLLAANTPIMHYVFMVALPYVLFCMAYNPIRGLCDVGKYGDFSYGLYLYAFPVQQSYMYFIGERFGFIIFIMISVLISLILAVLSWYVIEKPFLKLKKKRFRLYSTKTSRTAESPALTP